MSRVTGLPVAETDMLLWLTRLSVLILDSLDLSAEYRLRYALAPSPDGEQMMHGMLVEAGYTIFEYARIGVGYNFSRFSEDLLARDDQDAGGFFVRVTGMY